MDSFKLYGQRFIKYQGNDQLHQGNYDLLPLECLFDRYILWNDAEMFFVDVIDRETYNQYDVVHIPIVSMNIIKDTNVEIDELAEENPILNNIDSVEMAKWLKERLSMKDILYIPERKPFSKQEAELVTQ